MTTDYDPIAEQYQRSKQQPWRTFIEAYTLLNLAGDTTGKNVLDVACGEGFYTRQLSQRGAASVTGLDLSPGMIQLARSQEETLRMGIRYVVGDARELPESEPYDLIVAAYLLNYASNEQELQAMCNGIAKALKAGGRFVTVNCSPLLHFPTAPTFRPYGFETSVNGEWQPGAPIKWTFHLDDGTFDIENYYLSVETHEAAFRKAGFQEIRWHLPQLSAEADSVQKAPFWDNILNHSPITFIECVR